MALKRTHNNINDVINCMFIEIIAENIIQLTRALNLIKFKCNSFKARHFSHSRTHKCRQGTT